MAASITNGSVIGIENLPFEILLVLPRHEFEAAIVAFEALQRLTPYSEEARRRLEMLHREQAGSRSL